MVSNRWRDTSTQPTWTIILWTDGGIECSKLRNFEAPGKQCVTALKNRVFLAMELPIIRVVGGKSRRGDVDSGRAGLDNGTVDFYDARGEVGCDGQTDGPRLLLLLV